MVVIQELGVVPYEDGLKLMKSLQAQRINDEIPDTLLILEHQEVVTVGPRARNDGIRPPEDYPTQAVDRGGGLTWHGPGQIVCYPVFKWGLRKKEASVAEIITKIEQWVIDALRLLNINGERDQRMQGVWVDGHKICSIGLSFLRWVSRHGFTVNVNTPPGRVESVAGCGLTKDTTTSLANLGYEVDGQAVKQALLDAMQFGPVIGS
ncbi:lipoyl(octanoyl) transferase LipB [Candidatus Poseidonia alphae]|nr:lipoyl(octanoyl) transferase LipB [Candidatus Poseidonia alphae]MDA8638275.1 lipoyl(octanoyl) transferase LipB [Candidatus Poseidonia alphae]MDB2335670.1 lipoyl(octanoyl) transferase LipB [Candidatus Poseidonia alphae]MDB2568949.1 lipoyl(octanoyl) transferase LipB [Candidatus Poseidonia alphae]